MPSATIFREFNHFAIASNLSGRQMQLWLKVYEFLNSYRRQDVQLYTPMLLDALHISLSQFRRARQGLIDAGFLSIRQDSLQHTSYTLLLNGGYQADLQAFSSQHPDGALSGWLQQWADMRRKNGWTLTRCGMQTLLDKLKTLADGNLQTMAAIVRQSVSRRWKGFYPLKAERKPSGEKLRRMEEQLRKNQPAHQNFQKFQGEQRDLSFLER